MTSTNSWSEASCKEQPPSPLAISEPEAKPSTKPATVHDSPATDASEDNHDLTKAFTLYREELFDEAAQTYQRLLQAKPNSATAYVGLTRVYLKQKKFREAHETISKGITVTDSPPMHVALGEVLFREGKLSEAENEWLAVINSGHADARAHLWLARVTKPRNSISSYGMYPAAVRETSLFRTLGTSNRAPEQSIGWAPGSGGVFGKALADGGSSSLPVANGSCSRKS